MPHLRDAIRRVPRQFREHYRAGRCEREAVRRNLDGQEGQPHVRLTLETADAQVPTLVRGLPIDADVVAPCGGRKGRHKNSGRCRTGMQRWRLHQKWKNGRERRPAAKLVGLFAAQRSPRALANSR
eukprot:scaffold11124_cov94-Isochrysis_galbana.AAC.3